MSYLGRRLSPVRAFLRRHERKLWWLHSTYALGLGIAIVMVAQEGFERARWLAFSLGVAWVLAIFFFRIFGSGAERRSYSRFGPKTRIQFFAISYVLKNLYQGMLFFLLPFYWKASTLDAPNVVFVALLALCAILSTLDLVFDHVLLRFRWATAAFHALTLFACLNLLVPALLPDTRSLSALMFAGAMTVVSVISFHTARGKIMNKGFWAIVLVAPALGAAAAWLIRPLVPPVPMYVAAASVGPSTLPDGRLAIEARRLHVSAVRQLIGVTNVVTPGGQGDRLHHVWRRNGQDVMQLPEATTKTNGPNGTVRLRSTLGGRSLPAVLPGLWTLDVETEDGQLVGRARFEVIE